MRSILKEVDTSWEGKEKRLFKSQIENGKEILTCIYGYIYALSNNLNKSEKHVSNTWSWQKQITKINTFKGNA